MPNQFKHLDERLADVAKDLPQKLRNQFNVKNTPDLVGNLKSIPKMLGGGPISGQGSGDIVPAMLEPGEFVLSKRTVQKIGKPTLEIINQNTQKGQTSLSKRGPAHFLAGGPVPPPPGSPGTPGGPPGPPAPPVLGLNNPPRASGFFDCCDILVVLLVQLVDITHDILTRLNSMGGGGGGSGGGRRLRPWQPYRAPFARGVNWMAGGLEMSPQQTIQSGERRAREGEHMQASGRRGGRWQEFLGRGQQAIGHATQGFQQTAEGRGLSGLGGLLRGAGSLAGNIPGIGKPIESLTRLGDSALKVGERFQEFNEKMRLTNFRFAEFSGEMAKVKADSEMRRIQIMMRQGDIRAPMAGVQAEITDKWLERKEKVGGFINAVGTGILEGLEIMFGGVVDDITNAMEKMTVEMNKMVEEQSEDMLDMGDWEDEVEVINRRRAQADRPAALAEENLGPFGRAARKAARDAGNFILGGPIYGLWKLFKG